MKTEVDYMKKMNIISTPSAKLAKKKKRQPQMTEIRDEGQEAVCNLREVSSCLC